MRIIQCIRRVTLSLIYTRKNLLNVKTNMVFGIPTINEMTFSAPSVRANPELVNPPVEVGAIAQTRLLQNYPDPFNPETWIPYELAEDADVTVEIYDSIGQEARRRQTGQRAIY